MTHYRDWLHERLILALLHSKREIKNDNLELVKELNDLQRILEAEYGTRAVVLSDEYSPEPGFEMEGF